MQEVQFQPTQTLLLVFAGCHLAAMSSVITNPIMYGILNANINQVVSVFWYKIYQTILSFTGNQINQVLA
jgi:hypothetical protein